MLKKIIQKFIAKRILNEAAICFQKNQFQEAVHLYQKILNKDSENYEANLWIGSVYSESKKYVDATNYLNKAINIKPDDHRAYFNLAHLQANLSRHVDAIELFEKASKCKSSNSKKAEIYYNIGLLYWQIGKYQEAIDFANKALSIFPADQRPDKLKMLAYQRLKN